MLASFAASEGGGTLLPAFLSATFRAAFRPSKVLTVSARSRDRVGVTAWM